MLRLSNVVKSFGAVTVLRGIDLTIADGELMALLGASGSGKTTLLRILAGLDWPDAGALTHNGADWLKIETQRRRVGFVFQHYALFDHLTVFENVAFGLRIRPRRQRPDAITIAKRVGDLLELVQLPEMAGRFPTQLSGGQRQRVALARALAIEPAVLLLDEPFGALDARVRQDLRRWLRALHRRIGMTTVFVTHDQDEAFELADRVVVMGAGTIDQVGRPEDILDHPASPAVARFLGGVNEVRLPVDGVDVTGLVKYARGNALLFARPQDVEPITDLAAPGRIARITATATAWRYDVDLPGFGSPLLAECPRGGVAPLQPGAAVALRIHRGQIFPTD